MNQETCGPWKTLPARIPAILNLGVLGLLAGLAFCVQVALVPIWNRLDAPGYVTTMQATIPAFTLVVKPLMMIGFISFLVRLFRQRPRWSVTHGLILASFLFFIAAGVITTAMMWPLNSQMMNWPAQNPPTTWEAVRVRWDHLNTWRFVCAQLGFLTGLISLLAGSR